MNRIPIQLGTLHIREAINCATKDELDKLSMAWKTANFPPISRNLKIN